MLKSTLAATALVALVPFAHQPTIFGSGNAESAAAFNQEEDDDAEARKEAKVLELLELTGAADLGMQMMDGMMDQFELMPGLPDGFIDAFRDLADVEELMDLIIPIYMDNLDEKTIDGAIRFFGSPDGRALQEAQPIMLEESMKAGQEWGADLAERAMANVGR